ncbi:MAG: PEP-CTERM sorting domain-containing protein [Acidobacteriaceae bacterium]|nr:PEP-CTERM sorting domain-containing protein [Acidobacteriaceae bacterium]
MFSLFLLMFTASFANADAIYTFYDQNNNIVVQFTAQYIATPSTPPEQITAFTVAPTGFLPCSLSILSGATPGNTLACSATGLVAGQVKTWDEIFIVMNGVAFPTTAGSFAIPFGDVQWGFSGDVPVNGGRITVSDTPEPTSLVLFGTGVLGLAGLVRKRLLG